MHGKYVLIDFSPVYTLAHSTLSYACETCVLPYQTYFTVRRRCRICVELNRPTPYSTQHRPLQISAYGNIVLCHADIFCFVLATSL